MRSLVLKCGAVVHVDEADFPAVSQHDWHVSHNGYAIRRVRHADGRKSTLYMHREIFGADAPDVDHADGHKLNNCRANMRAATRTLNNANSKPREGCTSRFKGVAWQPSCSKWWAYINRHGKRTTLGYFVDETEAAKAYNAAAPQFFGEFARLNVL